MNYSEVVLLKLVEKWVNELNKDKTKEEEIIYSIDDKGSLNVNNAFTIWVNELDDKAKIGISFKGYRMKPITPTEFIFTNRQIWDRTTINDLVSILEGQDNISEDMNAIVREYNNQILKMYSKYKNAILREIDTGTTLINGLSTNVLTDGTRIELVNTGGNEYGFLYDPEIAISKTEGFIKNQVSINLRNYIEDNENIAHTAREDIIPLLRQAGISC